MPQKRKRILVVMTPAAYKAFEEWLKQQLKTKEVGHEARN